jgi:hypothetical protein
MLKLDFQRAVLNRMPKITANPRGSWRDILFVADEYHAFATVGERIRRVTNAPSRYRDRRVSFPSSPRRALARCDRRCPVTMRGGRCCSASGPSMHRHAVAREVS